MQCPFCEADKDKVIDSRSTDEGRAIRRRRECMKCGKRFTTYEQIEMRNKRSVIKKDGSRVPYDRQKILFGLEKACYKRPVAAETLTKIIEEIEEELFGKYEREIDAMEIGRAAADRLKQLDQVAYVRFASVYKQFRDLDDFLEEVREVLDGNSPDAKDQGLLF